MKINRRSFIRTTGSIAFAGVAASIPALSVWSIPPERTLNRRRVAVFFDPAFPGADGMPIGKETLVKALEGFNAVFCGASEIKSALDAGEQDVFVNPYGSAFPKDVYQALIKYLTSGGNWVNLGGIPMSLPVASEGGTWRQEARQSAYHKKLGITQAFGVPVDQHAFYHPAGGLEGCEELLGEFTAKEVYELYVRFSVTRDYPLEDGSAGARDATLRTLLFASDAEGRKIAAPFIQIDRLQGDYAGGRWMLANFKGRISAKAIGILTEMALQGSSELSLKTSFACYNPGETPSFTVQFRRPKGDVDRILKGDCRLELIDENQKQIDNLKVTLQGSGSVATGYAVVPSRLKSNLQPGLYHARVKVTLASVSSDAAYGMNHSSGFWVMDKKLLEGGMPLAAGKDYFIRGGEPYPVTGTTYMTSDVHRKFLLEPNPYLWNKDFAEMKASGVNMVRTGIWTAWKNYMLDVGSISETALRAMDAFLLTARRHDIPVLFTFFAFLPEAWGGANAYLDPRSVSAQKEFLSAFAQRYAGVNDIIWDLINEPSFCSSNHLWSCRPNYDKYEISAWNAWLKERYPAAGEPERLSKLQEQYRAEAGDPIDLPPIEEFSDVNIFNDKKPVRVIDYRLFAQEMFRRWVIEMTAAIRSNSKGNQMITVGQDEGGTLDRPGPQFFGSDVDFTSIHNWWFNDSLVWDSVMTKIPGKLNLVEETGVMFYEKMDGSPWRTEEDAGNLLERKLAISMAAGGAGFLEWIWNTNPYMNSDNEAAIGLLRVDGTAKPEISPLIKYSKFFHLHRNLLSHRQEEEVLMVIPHSQMFSTRNFATDATRMCVRAMYYHLSTPMIAVSEYSLEKFQGLPKLVVAPSPRTLSQNAWKAMMRMVEEGSTLLFTGIMDTDDHWMDVARGKALGLIPGKRPVSQEEFIIIDGQEHQVSYRGDKIQRIEKALAEEGGTSRVRALKSGKGTLLWSPLPLEASDSVEPVVALYGYALKQSSVSSVFSARMKDSSILMLPAVFEEAAMCTLVSESDRDAVLQITHNESKTEFAVTVPAGRAVTVFIRRNDGKVLGRTS